MQIHWAHFPVLESDQRMAVEQRIQRLAEEKNDLIDVRIVAAPTHHHRQGGQQVRLTCVARGRRIVASSERAHLGPALDDVIESLERQVHRLRERRAVRHAAAFVS